MEFFSHALVCSYFHLLIHFLYSRNTYILVPTMCQVCAGCRRISNEQNMHDPCLQGITSMGGGEDM